MQNGAHNTPVASGRLLGFVRVLIGGQQFQAQIEKGTVEAVRHLSQKFLN